MANGELASYGGGMNKRCRCQSTGASRRGPKVTAGRRFEIRFRPVKIVLIEPQYQLVRAAYVSVVIARYALFQHD